MKKRPRYLRNTVIKIDGFYSLGLLWRAEFPNLSNKTSLALSLFSLLKKEIKNNPELHTKYQKTIKSILKKSRQQRIKMTTTRTTL